MNEKEKTSPNINELASTSTTVVSTCSSKLNKNEQLAQSKLNIEKSDVVSEVTMKSTLHNMQQEQSLVASEGQTDKIMFKNQDFNPNQKVVTSKIDFYQQAGRRVTFPKNDNELITGYLEPANPWETVKYVSCRTELADLYKKSCEKHNTKPIESVIKHLDNLDLTTFSRSPILNLREQILTPEACEALEEIFKRIQYRMIDIASCGLNDLSASSLFDMIEYYEATNELDVSENHDISIRGWQSCINMIKKSQVLHTFAFSGSPISDANSSALGKAMNNSSLVTIKLEHCGLSGRPIASLCMALKKNTVLKELWLANNDLTSKDALSISSLLKTNFYLQFIDISNNNIQDIGLAHIVDALIDQAIYFNKTNDANSLISESISSNISDSSSITSSNIVASTEPNNALKIIKENFKTKKSSNDNNDTSKYSTSTMAAGKSMLNTLLSNMAEQNIQNKEIKQEKENLQNEKNSLLVLDETNIKKLVNTNTEENNIETSMPIEHMDLEMFNTNNNNIINNNINNNYNDNKIIEENIKKFAEENFFLDTVEKNTLLDFHENIDINKNTSVEQSPSSFLTNKNMIHNEINNKIKILGNIENNEDKKDLIDFTSATKPSESVNSVIKDNSLYEIILDTEIKDNMVDSDININNSNSYNKNNIVESVNLLNLNNDDLNTNDEFLNANSSKELQIDNKEINLDILISGTNMENVDKGIKKEEESLLKSDIDVQMKKDFIPELAPIVNMPKRNINSTASLESLTLTPESPSPIISQSSCFETTESSPTTDNVFVNKFPERSFSSESLNSETSIDSNDSKSSIKIAATKFSKNGTLERQTTNTVIDPPTTNPCGLQVLVLWNNHLTRESARSISDLLKTTSTLEILNVGRNVLSNDFLLNIKNNLKTNTSLTNLGLQSAHLSCSGMKILSDILQFGGNSNLQRIDLRDNNIQVPGLNSVNDALKSNKCVTRIDIDDVPKRFADSEVNTNSDYLRLLTNIRAQCSRNENPPEPEPVRTCIKRAKATYLSSRKISLTCQSIKSSSNIDSLITVKPDRYLLDPNKKTSGRLRSPLPSPIPSPIASPVPSPSRSRFQVSRVVESGCKTPVTPPSSTSCSPTNLFTPSSRFRVTIVEPSKQTTNTIKPINTISVDSTKDNNEIVCINVAKTKSVSTSTTNLNTVNTSASSSPTQITTVTSSTTTSTVCTKPIKQDTNIINIPNTTLGILTSIPTTDVISTSFDSPDLEVKRYMDDSCSSISSLDSIDRQHDFNISMSSTDSFDFIGTNDQPYIKSNIAHSALGLGICNNKLYNNSTKLEKIDKKYSVSSNSMSSTKTDDSSLSSLENCGSLNDSISDSQETSILTKTSSNEGTLTNTPCEYQSLTIDTYEAAVSTPTTTQQSKAPEKRVRKTSWINPLGKSDGGYPATLDKLLSLFQHPSSLFTKGNNDTPPVSKKDAQPQEIAVNVAIRKESPMSGLFSWTSPSPPIKKDILQEQNVDENDINRDKQGLNIELTSFKTKTDIQQQPAKSMNVLQPNISPDNTITATTTFADNTTIIADTIPKELKQEIKENISPDHTVTASTVYNIKSQSPERVHFEVGGDDEDDIIDVSDEDIDDNNENDNSHSTIINNKNKFKTGRNNSNSSDNNIQLRSNDSTIINSINIDVSGSSGLGIIARDSLSILRHHPSSINSQDSMPSLESLLENEVTVTSLSSIITNIDVPITTNVNNTTPTIAPSAVLLKNNDKRDEDK